MLAPVEDQSTLIPSAVFFDYETRGRILYGTEAIQTYVGQTEGRLMPDRLWDRAMRTQFPTPKL